jgi:very-short-patch-repair endonuclease
MPRGELKLAGHPSLPVLLIPGEFRQALALSVSLIAMHPQMPVALACDVANVVESLLTQGTSKELVIAALQGLVPIEDTSQKIVKTVAEARQLEPFIRGPCEGLLYYMLEARQQTRGRFKTNGRLTKTIGLGSHEVDLLCVEARLVIEIDGPEHNNHRRRAMDARKQRDLEGQGYRVRRFSNQEIIENPVGVWHLVAEDLDMHIAR